MGLHASAALAQTLVSGPGGAITVLELNNDLLRVPPEVRANTFSRPEPVHNTVSNLYVRRVLAAEALQSGLAQDPAIEAALLVARERVLSEARLAQIDKANQPTDASLEAYARATYTANPKRFESPEQVRIRHILLRGTDASVRSEAELLLQAIKAGSDFEQLAKTRSQDPGSAQKGGDLGWVARGRTVKPFEDEAFKLDQPGALSGLVQTSFGWHIIKLEERRAAGVRSFEDSKDVLMKEARAALANRGRQAEQDRILATAKFDQAAIEAFAKAQRQ